MKSAWKNTYQLNSVDVDGTCQPLPKIPMTNAVAQIPGSWATATKSTAQIKNKCQQIHIICFTKYKVCTLSIQCGKWGKKRQCVYYASSSIANKTKQNKTIYANYYLKLLNMNILYDLKVSISERQTKCSRE